MSSYVPRLVPHQSAHDRRLGNVLHSDQPSGRAAHPLDRVDHATRRRDAAGVSGIEQRMRDVGVYLYPRFALDHDTVYAGMTVGWELPVRPRGGGQPGDMLEGDHRSAVADALGGKPNRGHLSRLHRHHCAIDALWCEPSFAALADLVEFYVKVVRQTAHL